MARTKKYQPTEFMLPTSHYDKERADHAVNFIQSLKHTKGVWAGQPFLLFDWQEKIIRDLFGTIKANGYRQFNTAFVEICKKAGKSELAAAVALYMLAGDGEEGAEIYGCANDRQQASIVFDVAKDWCSSVLHCSSASRSWRARNALSICPHAEFTRCCPRRSRPSTATTSTPVSSTSCWASPIESCSTS